MSGSIWSEEDSTYEEETTYDPTPIGGARISGPTEAEAKAAYRETLEAQRLKDEPRKRLNKPIAPARRPFAKEAERLRQLLMRLLEASYAVDEDSVGEIIDGVCEALEDVDALSLDIRNESERDLYAICDLLAISLATTCGGYIGPSSPLRFRAENTPYLKEALA